ncbi:MAG: hypothetical protein ABIR06_16555 [Cyclobacteriaceae bacterium]
MQVINHDTALSKEVIKTLLYFDIFNYPLKGHEVHNFLSLKNSSEQDIVLSLNALVESKIIFRLGDFYSIQSNYKLVERRVQGNAEANKHLKIAKSKARFIAQFPFVRAVMASGSLSKGYMDKKSDLDFFVVTKPGRLWIARTLLVMYKRIFLNNSHREFCVNYFVDTLHLEIEEKNLFTATELATLIPLYNQKVYSDLQSSNPWQKDFLPNFRQRNSAHEEKLIFNPAIRLIEMLLNIFGQGLDNFFMRLTFKRWNKIYGDRYGHTDFNIAFKTKKYVSKNHPKNYQKTILDLLQCKLVNFQNQFNQFGNHE